MSNIYQQHRQKLEASFKTIYHELKAREYGLRWHNHNNGVQRLYEFVAPNKTYHDVPIDGVCYHIRRFTDDGKYLVCFPETLDGIIVYWFNFIPSTPTRNGVNIFNQYFTLKYHRTYTMEYEHTLCDDFLLIINENKHLVFVSNGLATTTTITTTSTSPLHPQHMQDLLAVFDYTFYIADIETGEQLEPVEDIMHYLPTYDGWMTGSELEMIQHSCSQIDDQSYTIQADSEQHHVLPYSGFKDALLRWLFIQARDGRSLPYFYNRFLWYESLQLWRMQFMDRNTLLIKLVSHQSVFLLYEQETTWKEIATLFVIFDWRESRVIDAFDNSSIQVARTLFNNASQRACVSLTNEIFRRTSMVDDSTEYEELKRAISGWTNKEDTCAAMMKLSLLLPIPPLSQARCPYFNRRFFSYSLGACGFGWWVPQVRKLRFYSKQSGKLIFEIGAQVYYEEEYHIEEDDDDRTMMLVIPHPQLPFMITRHKVLSSLDLVTNFHVYNPA
ncbi:hypothetical protein K492DRAFT_187292 [Lichtheimia hyalospora FSU 10163]|nr:hypothetical protein K492DRAFT_187292 [Lichtheimia hyalospora FSU 10163]